MAKNNYDDKVLQGLDKKLGDFFKKWDSTPKEERNKMLNEARMTLESIKDMDMSTLSDTDLQVVQKQVTELLTAISDIQLALGHRIIVSTNELSEQIKREAEKGNPEAIEAWEKLKDDYYKAKYSDLGKS